jgi:quinol monooxygenase YgiN
MSGGGAVTELIGIARFEIHEGKFAEFERLSAEAEEIVRTRDPGTLQYDTFFNDARTECVIVERYRDSDAAMAHAENLAEVSAAVIEIVTVVHGELLGDPSPELRAKLANIDVPQLFTPYRSLGATSGDIP